MRKILLIAIAATTFAATAQKSITQREAWLDNNFDDRQTVAEGPLSIDISALHIGLHKFTMRVQDSEGLWSPSVSRYFLIPAEKHQTSIVKYQYWLDNNIAERQTLANGPATVDISSLNIGLHKFTMRVQNNEGLWSPSVSRYFLVPADDTPKDSITHCCYWFDDNKANAATVAIAEPGDPVEVDITKLSRGEHILNWVVGDSKGAWSNVLTASFVVDATLIGDVNGDGEIDVKDVTALIGYILGDTPENFVLANANVNQDPSEEIDVQDVTALISLILK
ncbi:MAG: dockerin type I repeat-containing protein [Muribaculaceae bacterium]|nr:dockerin type I repeat-containing protein [Muribaculaceae bacterium]